MKINGWPEAERGCHLWPSQREVQELIGIRVYTLNKAQKIIVQIKFFFPLFSYHPSLDQSKDTNPKDVRSQCFQCL